jgi:hypothetical protein
MENLNAAFADFLKSEQAKKEPEDLGDWRARNVSNAQRNGDAHADANPDTSLIGAIFDPTADEDDDDPFGSF